MSFCIVLLMLDAIFPFGIYWSPLGTESDIYHQIPCFAVQAKKRNSSTRTTHKEKEMGRNYFSTETVYVVLLHQRN
jgi:hypothetical protein